MADHIERRDRNIREHVHDPYHMRLKPKEPTICPRCGTIFHQGRWQWPEHPPQGAHQETCPACRRIEDDCPAGFLTVEGLFTEDHRQEILNLLRNEGLRETAEHPLDRIMSFTPQQDGGILVTTTDIHLARRLGEALHSAYRGQLSFHYEKGEYLLRVRWIR